MSRINGINFSSFNGGRNMYTKRSCIDNSEIYITSKLNMLYEKTKSDMSTFNSKRALKKIVEGNSLDELI